MLLFTGATKPPGKAPIMSTVRSCSHCLRALTDAASLDAGVGPICRGFENKLYAKALAADARAARDAFTAALLLGVAPETAEVLEAVHADVLETVLGGGEEDLRKLVKRVDWALSYAHPKGTRTLLIQGVKALGYIGLAAILAQSAGTGAATVVVDGTVLRLTAPQNKAASFAFKKIPGRIFSSVTKRWTFPVWQVAKVKAVVQEFYPCSTVEWATIEMVAAILQAPVAEIAPPAPPPAGKTSVTRHQGTHTAFLRVVAPYNPAFIAAVKALPYQDRAWNAGLKMWEVRANQETAVLTLIATHYGETPVVVDAAAAAA